MTCSLRVTSSGYIVLDPDHLRCHHHPSFNVHCIIHRNPLGCGYCHLGTWSTSCAVIITLIVPNKNNDGSRSSDGKNNGRHLLISISVFVSVSIPPSAVYRYLRSLEPLWESRIPFQDPQRARSVPTFPFSHGACLLYACMLAVHSLYARSMLLRGQLLNATQWSSLKSIMIIMTFQDAVSQLLPCLLR